MTRPRLTLGVKYSEWFLACYNGGLVLAFNI